MHIGKYLLYFENYFQNTDLCPWSYALLLSHRCFSCAISKKSLIIFIVVYIISVYTHAYVSVYVSLLWFYLNFWSWGCHSGLWISNSRIFLMILLLWLFYNLASLSPPSLSLTSSLVFPCPLHHFCSDKGMSPIDFYNHCKSSFSKSRPLPSY